MIRSNVGETERTSVDGGAGFSPVIFCWIVQMPAPVNGLMPVSSW